MTHWRIHLKHPGGATTSSFRGSREEAERYGAQRIGKPASWNVNKEPNEPNMWDCYTSFRVEEVRDAILGEGPDEGTP